MSKCLGRDISVRQHSKSEHWAPCHIQTPSRYDWKRLKATLSPNQTNTSCTDFSRLESQSVPSYLAEFLKRGNSSARIEELRRGWDSRGRKVSRSNWSKKIQNKTKWRVKRHKHLCLYKVAYFRVNVEVYIPNPLRCRNCQNYGHHEDKCSKDPICSKCGQTAEHQKSRCKNEIHCVNCGEKLSADSKECRIWHKEKEILRIKFIRNISFVEARKLVEAPSPIPGISYANITQSSRKKVSVVDTATQTDPITVLDSAVQSNTTNTNSQPEELQKQKVQSNITNRNQTKTPIDEKTTEVGLKKATMEMIKIDKKKNKQDYHRGKTHLGKTKQK